MYGTIGTNLLCGIWFYFYAKLERHFAFFVIIIIIIIIILIIVILFNISIAQISI